MDPELRKYLERADVRTIADQIMGDGAADKMLVRILRVLIGRRSFPPRGCHAIPVRPDNDASHV